MTSRWEVSVTWCSLPALLLGPGSWGSRLEGQLKHCMERMVCSAAVLCPAGVTVDPAARNIQILWCQYWWQVTGESGQAQVKLTEAVSLS